MTVLPPILGLNPLLNPLPAKWAHLRPHQLTSILDILDAFNRVDVVVYDAPVGSGKSAVATVMALMLQARSVYICHNRDLQQQFLSDVPYARLLEGRSNYKVDHPFPDLTCADCTLQTKNGEVIRNCELCDNPAQCAYKVARLAAIKADLAVLNMNYWLRSRAFDDRDLVVVDECLPEGTLIATPWGSFPIETLRTGDVVLGYDHLTQTVKQTQITRTYQRDTLENIHTVNGVGMTGNHPVSTDRGYVPAAQLTPKDKVTFLVERDQLQVVPAEVQAPLPHHPVLFPVVPVNVEPRDEPEDERRGSTVSGGAGPSPGRGEVRRVAERPSQSDLRPEGTRQGSSDDGSERVGHPQRGQRDGDDAGAGSVGRGSDGTHVRPGMGGRTCSENGDSSGERVSDLLQDRLSLSRVQAGGGVGRAISQSPEDHRSRSTERGLSAGSGLEGPPVREQDRREEPLGGSQGHPRRVFNLATGTSNFFAGGLLVHNCDVLEKVLMGEVEVNVSARYQRDLDIQPPARMTKQDSHLQWSIDARARVAEELSHLTGDLDVKSARRKEHLETLADNLTVMAHDISSGRPWVYCGGAGSDRRQGSEIVFKPVEVSSHGLTRIWGRGKKFLLMSGSVISAGMLTRGLGLDRPYETVSIPSTFPAKNRQVVVRPVANMTRAGQAEGSLPVLVRAVENVLDEHPSDRVLVHTVSYQLAEGLAEGLAYLARPILTYRTAKDRQQALSDFKTESGAVLLAPSMDRGIDLPDDDCRVQILVKVPYPSLGDKQIAERLYNTKDGAAWYNVAVARTVLQMSGRGVRHIDDHCVSIILDSSFVGWYGRWQHLLPAWFRAAVRFERG